MLRIEIETDGPRIVFRLIGRLQYDYLETLRHRLQQQGDLPIALDLEEIDLVDAQSVRFLCDCQDQNVELRKCVPYITEWIRRERLEGPRQAFDR